MLNWNRQMKRLMVLVVLLAATHVFGDAWLDLPDGWYEPTGYSCTMTLFARVLAADGKTNMETPGSTLAAFDRDEHCRGLAEAQADDNGRFFYRLAVFSNQETGDSLHLRLLDGDSGEIVEIQELIAFQNGARQGAKENPLLLHVGSYLADLQAMLRIARPGRPDECLTVKTARGVQDAYSDSKDVLAQPGDDEHADAFLVGETAEGESVELAQSVHRAMPVAAWDVVITVKPGESATISGEAVQPEGIELYLLSSGSRLAVPLSNESLELKNEGGEAREWRLGLICAVPEEGIAVRDITPGWNLVSFAFQPSAEDNEALMAFSPLALEGTAYAKATSIEANCGYWILSREKGVFLASIQPSAPAPALTDGWHLLPADKDGEQADAAWQWQGDRFQAAPVDQLMPGRAYWLAHFGQN